MNVLFICKYNKFRSKLAEAFFNKNTKQHTAKSAGIIKGSPVDEKIKNCASRHGIKVGGISKGIDVPLLRWQELIVIVADDIPRSLFKDNVTVHGRKLIHWKVPDTKTEKISEMDKITKSIEKKVLILLKEIEN